MATFKTALAKAAIYTVGALPLYMARILGSWTGLASGLFNTRMAQVTTVNITACLPHLNTQEQKRLVKQSLMNTGMLSAEICYVFTRKTSPEHTIKHIHNEHIAKDALTLGKGLMVLAPHLGNWEILGWRLTHLAPVTNLYQPPKISGLEPLLKGARQRNGSTLAPTNAKGVSQLLKALRAGQMIGILPDQCPNDLASGVFASFFGHSALTITLAHKLVKKTGAQAVFAFAKRVPGGFDIYYHAAPEDFYSNDEPTAIRALNKGVEQLVLQAPEQYQWEYKRFKHVPEGHNNWYTNI